MKSHFSLILLFSILALVTSEPALAGPGGTIVSAAYESFWGRIILVVLTIVFLPLIIYITFIEKRAIRRARKDLSYMSQMNDEFEWLNLKQRVKECFTQIHAGWDDQDLSKSSSWMTEWYWQNQQLVFLEKWRKKGLVNISNVKKIMSIEPILFIHKNQSIPDIGSVLVVTIKAKMNDYLQDKNSLEIFEGSKRFKVVKTIWTFKLDQGGWKVSDIEDSSTLFAHIKEFKNLPKIEDTCLSNEQT